MPTTYTDQTFADNFDPVNSGSHPTDVTVVNLTLLDGNDDGFITRNSSDRVNDKVVTRVYEGDTVTMSDGTVITGTTFYTQGGGRYFTPNDGSDLQDGTVIASTFNPVSTSFDLDNLGPPCFCAGTLIRTPEGEVPVEDIRIGDLVETANNGPMPVRWVGRIHIRAMDEHAPIRFAKGSIRNTRDLWVSPQHRILLSDWRVQLLTGEQEVLCPAISCVNGTTITQEPCLVVDYCHIMFDSHQIVFAEGIETESFFVGDYLCAEESPVLQEILTFFPELKEARQNQHLARRCIKGFEAKALLT